MSALCSSDRIGPSHTSARGDDNDFDQHPRRRHTGLAGGPARRVHWVHPGVPNRVHLVVVADVSEPDLDLKQLRLRAAHLGQQCVDLGEDRPGLVPGALHPFCGLPAQIDGVAVDDHLGHPRPDMMARDLHASFS